MTVGVRKEFDADLYKKYNGAAIQATVECLNNIGLKAEAREEDYGADVSHVSRKGVTFYDECEIKNGWSGKWNPQWRTLQIPHRKSRLIEKYEGDSLFFWVWNKQMDTAWVVDSSVLSDDLVEEIPNRVISSGEYFYCIPLGLCCQINRGGVGFAV